MILVLFFVLLIVLAIIIVLSYIRIKVEKVNMSNIPEYHYDFIIKFGVYLFNKIRIIEIKIDKEKIKKSKLLNRLKENISQKDLKLELEKMPNLKDIKKIDINLEQIDLNVKLGTEDVILTSVLVAFISATTGLVLGKAIKRYDEEKYRYIILPFYNNKNLFELQLNCIINVKLVHIIYVIYMFSKKRSENKYERTSNRRSYDYSYE